MQIKQLSDDAMQFAKHLNGIEGLPKVECLHKAASNVFVHIYHEDVPEDAGVYSFYLPEENIFYIGCATNFKKRIWHHINAAQDIEEGMRGFPNCVFGQHDHLSASEREQVRRGEFCLDYLTVRPATLAPVFEAYLQGLHLLRYGNLPACNLRLC
jgi:hypothetical protein